MVATRRKQRRAGAAFAPDMRTVGEGLSYPGIDPREWVSYGTVSDEDPVTFDPDFGPLVSVVLQPSKRVVICRVVQKYAGDGEGEYYPWVAGDEVLVVMPGGESRGGPVILGRLSNSIDAWPIDNVGGQNPQSNAFGFERTKAPFIKEVAGPYMLRSALSGAFLSIDSKGTLTLRDGDGAALQMSSSMFGYQGPSASGPGTAPAMLFQLDLTGHRMTMQVDDALFTLSGSKASPKVNAIATTGALSISVAGQPPAEHVTTTEAVANIISQVFNTFGTAIALASPGPLSGAALGAAMQDPAFASVLAGAITLAAVSTLPTFAGAVPAAIASAFASATQKPAGVPGQGQLKPGIGCVGLKSG